MANIRVTLTDSVRVIEQRVNKAIASKMNSTLMQGRGLIVKRLRPMVVQWVSEQREMVELRRGGVGSLASQLGLVAGTEEKITNTIIQSVAASIEVDFRKVSDNLKSGGITIQCQLANFSDLLSLPEGFVQDNKLVGELHWLRWLLKEGHTPIIVGYTYEPKSGFGRSKGGIMGGGGMWRVPPQYAGTLENNFVTRAFEKREAHIQRLLEQVLGG